jgi:hypothetical protein
VNVPRHGGGDDAEAGPFDALETDGPVAFFDAEVVEFGGKRLVGFFADGKLVTNDPEHISPCYTVV